MTATVTQLSSPLTNRIQRIEISATMAVSAEAEKLRATGVDLVDLGAGEPHFSTPQHIKDAAIAAINNNFTKYTAVGGIAELRDAVVKRHAADFGSAYYARSASRRSVANTRSSMPSRCWWTTATRSSSLYRTGYLSRTSFAMPAASRSTSPPTRRTTFKLTADMVERAITPRTKMIVLNSPNNPSGSVMSPEDMTAVLRLAHERGIYVVSDECYVYLNYTGQLFSAGSVTDVKERLLIIGSLSKTYAMTGWRLGYALGPAPVIAAMQKLQSQSTSNPTSIVQKAAVAALTGSQNCLQEMRGDYIKLRDKVVAGLRAIPGLTCAAPNGAFYAYPNVSHYFGRGGMNSACDAARKLLHEAHVVVVPGEALELRSTYACRTPSPSRTSNAGWIACASSLPGCEYANCLRGSGRQRRSVPSGSRLA